MALEVVPAIIPDSLDHLKKQADAVRNFVPLVQVDIIDGVFAPPKSWPYKLGQDDEFEEVVAHTSKLPFDAGLHFELDMMVKAPEKVVDDWAKAGASGMIVHVGSTDALPEVIEKIKGLGIKLGLALVPSTPNEEVYEWIEKVDFVQLMGNDRIGYHGVQLDERVHDKARDLRERHPELTIGVDIGVNFDTAPSLVDAGVNKLVAGSAIFESRDVEEAIKRFKNI